MRARSLRTPHRPPCRRKAPPMVAFAGTGQDFSLSANPSSNSVTAVSAATYTVNVNPAGGFNQAVALTCTEPQSLTLSTCSVSPTSVTPNGTSAAPATVTVTTTAGQPCAVSGPTPMGGDLPWGRLVLALLEVTVALALAP